MCVDDSGTSGDIVAALGACMTDTPFCKLHTLVADSTVLPLKHLVFVPSIASLNLQLDRESVGKQIVYFLPSLLSQCPFLKEIIFDSYSAIDVPAVSEHLHSWAALDSVEVLGLDDRALIHLGSMPHLRKLSFSPVPEHQAGQPFPLNTFPSLQSLEFRASGRRSCYSFMKSVGTLHIHRLCLDILWVRDNSLHSDITWVELFRAVSKHCARLSLRHFEISGGFPRSSPLTLDDFKPLFLFSNLTVFDAACGNFVDDAFIKAMAMAWPHLQRLSFNCYPGDQHARTTLRGLAHLAFYCKELESVYLSIDCTVVPPTESWPHGPLMNESVKLFDFPESPILDPMTVAPFLLHLFPNLNQININPYDPCAQKWTSVLEHLPTLKEVLKRSGTECKAC